MKLKIYCRDSRSDLAELSEIYFSGDSLFEVQCIFSGTTEPTSVTWKVAEETVTNAIENIEIEQGKLQGNTRSVYS